MLYRLAEFIVATWGYVFKPLWDALPPLIQLGGILALAAGLIWRNGHNAAVNAAYHEGVKRLDAQRRAQLK